jgi:hypothetical protein
VDCSYFEDSAGAVQMPSMLEKLPQFCLIEHSLFGVKDNSGVIKFIISTQQGPFAQIQGL